MKSVQIRSFFWSVFSRIQFEYGKIRTRKKSVFGHFSYTVSITNLFLHLPELETIVFLLDELVCPTLWAFLTLMSSRLSLS